jgi:hypothetical protein
MKNLFVGMGSWISDAWSSTTDWMKGAWDTTMSWMSSGISSAWEFLKDLPSKLFDAGKWAMEKYVDYLRWSIDFIIDLPNKLVEIGKQAITAVVDFITNPEETLKKITDFAGGIYDSIAKGMEDFGNKASEVFGNMIYGIRTMLPTWMGGIEPDTKTVTLNGEEITVNNKILRQYLDGDTKASAEEVEYAKKVQETFADEGIIEGNWMNTQNSISDERIAQLDAKTIKALMLSHKLGVADLDNSTLEKLAAQLQKVDPSLNDLGGSIVLPSKDESSNGSTVYKAQSGVPQKVIESQTVKPGQAMFGKSTTMSSV